MHRNGSIVIPTRVRSRGRYVALLILLAIASASPAAARVAAPEPSVPATAPLAGPTIYLPLITRVDVPPPTVFGIQVYGALDEPAAGLHLA
jgi:hypothetical protein